ncbi:hypothetical protein AB0D12_38540 [Streptomyces sp. NPDC048479]|uniref:hypothetical protein n=1 Tax=Streptomyces sp. NPDC048479 TaxID=3154725 RepID=UPI00343F2E8C
MSSLAPKGLTWSVLRLHRSALLVTAAFLAASVAAPAWFRTIGLEAARAVGGPCGSPNSGLPRASRNSPRPRRSSTAAT